MNPQRVVHSRERLREALEGRGKVFETADSYRRAVDERLFRLGSGRYAALMDTLIQLRQPQLSKKPDEAALSKALSDSLPPLASDLLGDVADALNRLEEDRRLLEEFEALEKAVRQFDNRYRSYAGMQSRRQSRSLRQAQTEFDNASRLRGEAQAQLFSARESEDAAIAAQQRAGHDLAEVRARLDTLRSDPAMQDANRLQRAEQDAADRLRALRMAEKDLEDAVAALRRHRDDTRAYSDQLDQLYSVLDARRRDASNVAEAAGVAAGYAQTPLAVLDLAPLADLPPLSFAAAQAELRGIMRTRREQIAVLRRRLDEVRKAQDFESARREAFEIQRTETDAASARREEADRTIREAADHLVHAWTDYATQLRQLWTFENAALAGLADWAANLEGENPAALALHGAQQHASQRLALARVELERRRDVLREEEAALKAEQLRLEAGEQLAPDTPYTRAADARLDRAGAPLWQLIEFHDDVAPASRAGLEAALEASGMLDSWVAPDGQLQTQGGTAILDAQAVPRRACDMSLAGWLRPASLPGAVVPDDVVWQLLNSLSCGVDDPGYTEAWIAADGRYRLSGLTGAWTKPEAVYIGFAAREKARARRIAEIGQSLADLAEEKRGLQALFDAQGHSEHEAAEEWRNRPSDTALRQAHEAASARARAYAMALEKLALAEARYGEAEALARAARQAATATASDLRLPEAASFLQMIEEQLDRFDDLQQLLCQTAQALRTVYPELRRQEVREREALAQQDERRARVELCRNEDAAAQAHLETLREAVGAKVEALQQRLADSVLAVEGGERVEKRAQEALRKAGEARAIATSESEHAEELVQSRGQERARAVARWQDFVRTGLLSAALPEIDLPDIGAPWTIDPALNLARRAEQALVKLQDSDEAWARVQRQVGEDFTDLQRALTALGHQVQAEQSDFGIAVNVIYLNRPERPDALLRRLTGEIESRKELLTANEREVFENHLQAEIATEVQRLLQAGNKQVEAINRELHKRPTSTGIRYRLRWEPLAEGAEGAPVGLDAARKRLLNKSNDLWTAEDRQVVGAMLQQRIAVEREQADKRGGASLLEQLARALDYRSWHDFRVERWQDGQWRKLSGPASSGERALGLTVPLFAAVASFYSQSGTAYAPRLVLLDEAFAGIDRDARAHCMALIREFELDFVITSESEWACYAELPGVSIFQLQRREGIDAVFVSRWTWDGRASVESADPDRRFPAS
jgi:uncharacterized protein (TIGR02680 family)